jgi:hypothetical protein
LAALRAYPIRRGGFFFSQWLSAEDRLFAAWRLGAPIIFSFFFSSSRKALSGGQDAKE